MSDPGSQGAPNPQGSESHAIWQGEVTAQVRENTRRLDAFNGKVDRIEEHIEQVRSDVRSLAEKLDGLIARMAGIEQSQTATLQNTSGVDWKTAGTIVTAVSLMVAPLIAAYFGAA